MSKRYKLAIVATHIIQYAVPLYHKINSHPDIDLTVYFCSDQGLGLKKDDKFGMKVRWDNVNLSGLNCKFLHNYSPFPNVYNFWGLINFGILNELRESKYDAIFINGYYTISAWLTFLAAYLNKTALILTGEPPSPYKSRLKGFIGLQIRSLVLPILLNISSAILYIGSESKKFYLSYKKYVKGLEEKLFFAPYSVDNDFLLKKADEYRNKKEEIKRELGVPANEPVILFLSNIIYRKQPLLLLESFCELKTCANLFYVGSGPELEGLKKCIKRFKIQRVIFFGFKNYTEIPKYYSIADIFVLPSLGESFGLVINEAMCFGLPIVTTDRVLSASDLVRNGENGYILPSRNRQALTDALEDLLSNAEKMTRMGERSREIISKWNYDRDVVGLLEALESIHKDKVS